MRRNDTYFKEKTEKAFLMLTLHANGRLSLQVGLGQKVEGRVPLDKAEIYDVTSPLHLTGTHLVAVASSNNLFIMSQVPHSSLQPIAQQLLLLKRLPFTEDIKAVRWIVGREEVVLAVVFETYVLFLGDDWRVWGSVEVQPCKILSIDSGPVALDQSFFFIINTSSKSVLYRVRLGMDLDVGVMLELDAKAEALVFRDYLGLEAKRGSEFYFFNGTKWESALYD